MPLFAEHFFCLGSGDFAKKPPEEGRQASQRLLPQKDTGYEMGAAEHSLPGRASPSPSVSTRPDRPSFERRTTALTKTSPYPTLQKGTLKACMMAGHFL